MFYGTTARLILDATLYVRNIGFEAAAAASNTLRL